MARRVPWRRTCPDVVANRIEDASAARIYLLRETGPTGFLLKEEGVDRKFKVFLGDQHSCTCQTFMKENELCIHILWVLLKKFRIPKENQIIFQLSLVEREINEVMRGCHHSVSNGREKLKQKNIETEDVCPICQEEFLKHPEPLTYCKYGCGNSVHVKCMKVWAEHQRSTGENIIKCPLCRVDFGSFQELMDEYNKSSRRKTRAERQDLHLGATCKKCMVCPIAGRCYRCVVCADYHLCHNCFATDTHTQHSFQFRQNEMEAFETKRQSDGKKLNRQVTDQEGLPSNIIYNLPSQMLQDRHRLLIDGSTCGVCLQGFQLRQTVRTLPCRHAFHILCIDNWLMNHSQCPVDGSYAGSVAMATSVTRKHPNGQLSVTLGTGRGSVGTISNHNLNGVSKRLGHHPKIHHQTHSERNELTGTLPSSFALSGSACWHKTAIK
ncbi:PREDICTED: E3 ubiquitin-protein ligase ZSWIM2-like [Acropora digitifera]|uniref:E3 ubiquitin-protein ligase ZSWIM2-like n=1 Tax=Acropora digitifera TaxID=70779 RepID=UPI00077A4312|nr:PREDICTED: E3 ubiquitin-protein ligase ZSWIM2-like [Acropora digitifera]